MEAAAEGKHKNRLVKRYPGTCSSDLGFQRRKRLKDNEGNKYNGTYFSTGWQSKSERKRTYSCSQNLDISDPFSLDLFNELDSGKFGSVTKDIYDLLVRRSLLLGSLAQFPYPCPVVQKDVAPKTTEPSTPVIIDLDDEEDAASSPIKMIVPSVQNSNLAAQVIIIDSDSDDDNDITSENLTLVTCLSLEVKSEIPSSNLLMKDGVMMNVKSENCVSPCMELNLKNPSYKRFMKEFGEKYAAQSQSSGEANAYIAGENESGKDDAVYASDEAGGNESGKDEGEYVGEYDDMYMEETDEVSNTNSDGLCDIWNEMKVALECSKDVTADALLDEHESWGEEGCEHSFILKDDIGDVCRICGVIRRGIESIIEYNFSKGTKSTRTYRYEGRSRRELDRSNIFLDGIKPHGDFAAAEIYPHPRHRKEMKPHQVEGFNFLLSNLVSDNPGGCILAHAPGSGKTFMIISFLQSFMAKYPAARPLVVLPTGILGVWKNEFLRWQVEDIPLYDFYSVKAESRHEQLEVLKEWEKRRSILFLSYKQFSVIVCDMKNEQVVVACQNCLLKIPSILILDEGHTPRNEDTDVLTSLERVETTRKVVLSGTLYQNHVKEVFNILNLVRPRFLKLETCKEIKRRIMSRAEISGKKNLMKNGNENEFYDLIEHTLTKDENYIRKVSVIQDLREMSKPVLHYYKGDNLDELPGLVDLSVFLRLSPEQTTELKELKNLQKFTISSQGSALYVHPRLRTLYKNTQVQERVDEQKIDAILEKFNVREGVKANFYYNLLQLSESNNEKLLVFSQYLPTLKFLERLTAKLKGYSIGREMFMITGKKDLETRESKMEKFNNTSEARVLFGSIKACGEGISLVGASRIIILDVHLNPSVTRQAIGRAFRPGQMKKVYTYRLIASCSPEEDDHATCFRKESISKLWFELDQLGCQQKLEMDTVGVNDCGDNFLETERLSEDVVAVFKR